ncbi:MAG: hypothetical protein Fur009_7830 [Candidatus Microgenomates bacterium]
MEQEVGLSSIEINKTFYITRKAIKDLGWRGSILKEDGQLKDFIDPSKGIFNQEFTSSYPKNLKRLLEFLKGETLNIGPAQLSFINLALVYNKAQEFSGGDKSKFQGSLGDLEDNPYFKLALYLTKGQGTSVGNLWMGLLDKLSNEPFNKRDFDNFFDNVKIVNGKTEKKIPEYPTLQISDLREQITGLEWNELFPGRTQISIKEALKLIIDNVK